MVLEATVNGQVLSYDLTKLAEQHQGIINIGRYCREVWNAIAIDDESVDPFQCNVIVAGDSCRLSHGQERTECPKGLMSNKLIPCNGCMGRCVNLHAGRPKYYQRNPESPTLVNGSPVETYGSQIVPGDVITLGNVMLNVK